jgi:S1-C subfamily serine protease
MRFLAGIFVVLLAWPVFAAGKMTAITIDGTSYVQIQDVHVVSGGRIVLLYGAGGTTLPADKVPAAFLDSWGITPDQIAAAKSASAKLAAQSLAQSIRAGYFREVDGIVYDLRKAQAGWRTFSDAKIIQVVEDGALVNPTPLQAAPAAVFVHHLPHVFADNEKASFMAKLTGDFSYIDRYGTQRTIHSYDTGRICRRNEIPDIILSGGAAAAISPSAARSGEGRMPARPSLSARGLRGIGSGFFVTKDGYFLTNFHVVREAGSIEIKYKNNVYKARVIQTDTNNDLALLKVTGSSFSALAISRQDSADLGDAVFTIGFPNIDMQGIEPKYTDGKISSLAGMMDDPSEYQISVPVQPGNSGGPLCDANGDVVGIIVARLNDMAALRESGAMPQNVNYAIKARHALRLLQSIKDMGTLPVSSGRPAKPVQAVEDAIGMVMIY